MAEDKNELAIIAPGSQGLPQAAAPMMMKRKNKERQSEK